MTLVDRVYNVLGPKAEVAWPPDLVVLALRMAVAIVWGDAIQPTRTVPASVADGWITLPPDVWPVATPDQAPVLYEAGPWTMKLDTKDPTVSVQVADVPPLIQPDTRTLGMEPDMDQVLALTAAGLLYGPSMAEAMMGALQAAEEVKERVLRERRMPEEWRIRPARQAGLRHG